MQNLPLDLNSRDKLSLVNSGMYSGGGGGLRVLKYPLRL